MNFTISNRMSGVEGSAIREILKLASDPNIISFGGGNPAADAFPIREIAEIANRALAEQPVSMLQYSLSEGYPPLREALGAFLRKNDGIGRESDRILIVSGSQQAADLATKALVNEGDAVLVEEPSFVGCLNCFRTYGAKLAGVPMDEDGVNLAALEEAMAREKNVRFFYTIPNFQNPTGITMSYEKRKRVYELAQKYGVVILEDNPYGELRFAGEPVPAIKTLDTDGRVIYCGSFSKVMAPAFRVAFLCADEGLMGPLVVGKQCADVHTNVLFQHICAEYLTKYDYAAHIAEIRELYAKKCRLILAALEREFHPSVRFTRPQGGLFISCTLPDGADAAEFVAEGIRRGVACVPGFAFMTDQKKPSSFFRMNFSTPTDEQIEKGVRILGRLTHERFGS